MRYTAITSTPNCTKMSYPDIEVNLDTMVLYILTLFSNIRSFNALIVKLEYTILALPNSDIIIYKLSQNSNQIFIGI